MAHGDFSSKKRSWMWLWILITILVLGVLATSGYFYWEKNQEQKTDMSNLQAEVARLKGACAISAEQKKALELCASEKKARADLEEQKKAEPELKKKARADSKRAKAQRAVEKKSAKAPKTDFVPKPCKPGTFRDEFSGKCREFPPAVEAVAKAPKAPTFKCVEPNKNILKDDGTIECTSFAQVEARTAEAPRPVVENPCNHGDRYMDGPQGVGCYFWQQEVRSSSSWIETGLKGLGVGTLLYVGVKAFSGNKRGGNNTYNTYNTAGTTPIIVPAVKSGGPPGAASGVKLF